MPRIEVSTRIAAPREKVWVLFCDAKRYPEWVVPTERMLQAPEGGLQAGSVYREYGGVPPFKSESEWKVTEFEPPRRQVHIGDDGMMTIQIEALLEPDGDGTLVTQRLNFKPRWFMLPMSTIMWALFMGRRARDVIKRTQENARKILEPAKA